MEEKIYEFTYEKIYGKQEENWVEVRNFILPT